MPTSTLGDQRWVQTGVNSGGDLVYSRVGPGMAGADVSASYSDMTKDELSAELESRGLPKSGTKDELIARLQEDDQ